jgi:hypothetical protein
MSEEQLWSKLEDFIEGAKFEVEQKGSPSGNAPLLVVTVEGLRLWAASTRYQCGVGGALREMVSEWRKLAIASREEAGRIRRTIMEVTEAETNCYVRAELWDKCADEMGTALARLEGCGAFFVVAPHVIGVSIGPPSGEPSSGLTPTGSAPKEAERG